MATGRTGLPLPLCRQMLSITLTRSVYHCQAQSDAQHKDECIGLPLPQEGNTEDHVATIWLPLPKAQM
eukprot:9487181-Pyramimonas_sp.AAC.2